MRDPAARRDPTVPVLAGCGAGLAAALGAMLWLGDLTEHPRGFVALLGLASACYGLAVAWVIRRPPARRAVLGGIFAAAVGFRLIVLPMVPTLSTDVYRYVWDGRLTLAGVDPYRHPPDAPELAALRDAAIYPRLVRPDWPTIYPPGAQFLFAAVGYLVPNSVVALKVVLTFFDLATTALLVGCLRTAGRPVAWALIHAWHPLVIVEFAGSGHLDAIVLTASMAALWAAMRGRDGWAGALVGVGTLLKLYPVLLIAAVTRRHPWRTLAAAAVVVAGGYGLHAAEGLGALGSLGRFVAEEEFNGGLRLALQGLLAPLGPDGLRAARFLPLAGLVLLTLGVGILGGRQPIWRRAFWLIGAYLIATPNLYPWYVLWMVPILALQPSWPWLYLTVSVGLAYVLLGEPVWHLPLWVTAAEFGPFVAGLLLAWWPRRAAVPPAIPDGARP